MLANTIETTVHGRFLHDDRGGDRLLAGFHGYAEIAESHMAELQKIGGIGEWSLLAIQALHPFYTRSGTVVANWMTSQDRELAIADNLKYVRKVLDTIALGRPGAAGATPQKLVFLGFSQGAAMAARAAAYAGPADGLILLGGDVPPEIREDATVRLPPVLLARGSRDDWYTEEKFNKDLSFLETKTRVTTCVFDGGHEWTDAFRDAAGSFLRSL